MLSRGSFFFRRFSTSKHLLVSSSPAKIAANMSLPRKFALAGGYFMKTLAAGTIGTTLYFATYPMPKEQTDPNKKTLLVLGSGWGVATMLKKLDTSEFNTVVVSPRNYFLYTPLLASVAAGCLEPRSIITPIKHLVRYKPVGIKFVEAEATGIDVVGKTVEIRSSGEKNGAITSARLPYDYLIIGCGAESQTFNIKGVKENTVFLKELDEGMKIREKIVDRIESASFPGQTQEEIDRLLHMVIVGGGPTGVEYTGQLYDFVSKEVKKWHPNLASRVKISLIEALPNILPVFSREMVDYTQETFKNSNINVLTNTCVKEVREKEVVIDEKPKGVRTVPFGLMVWAAGNTVRPLVKDFMSKISDQNCRRGILVDDFLRVKGTENVWALGDCTATSFAPTAQVASQQGKYLARQLGDLALSQRLKKDVLSLCPPFQYKHSATLAYIGNESAVSDITFPISATKFSFGGYRGYLLWRAAYLEGLYTMRNRFRVATDWTSNFLFGGDISRT